MRLLTRFVNALFLWRMFPLIVRIFSLVFFFFLMIVAFSGVAPDSRSAALLERTNLANLIVWAYWWPGIILAAVLFGRVWCIACPLELLTTLCAKIGMKRKVPRILLNGWPMTILYCAVLFIGVEVYGIDHYPDRMAIYLVSLLGFSALSGLIFENNTFCRSLCPVGRLLGLHARFAPFTWKVRYPEICSQCKDHSCIAKSNRYNLEDGSCGVGLVPAKLDDNTECILCGKCRKVCAANNPGIAGRPNPGWSIRKFAKDIMSLEKVRGADTLFLMVVGGFILSEVYCEWTSQEGYFMYIPVLLQSVLPVIIPEKLIEIIVVFILYPLVIWSLPYFLHRVMKGTLGFPEFAKKAAILLLPLIVGTHACIALLEMNAALPFIPLALSDPAGVDTAEKIVSGAICPYEPLFDENIVLMLLFCGISVALLFSLFLSHRLVRSMSEENKVIPLFSFYVVPVLYGALLVLSLCLRWVS